MIERNHLEIVREVDRCGSLTAAADALSMWTALETVES